MVKLRERVDETNVRVVSVSLCFQVNASLSTGYQTPFQLVAGASVLALSHGVFTRELLYLDVRPLGLQALDTGQNLLLVAGQSHAHLGQFAAGKMR